MISNTLTALVSAFNESELAQDVGPLYYQGQVPQGTMGSYITYALITDNPDRTMSETSEDILLQLTVWTEDSAPDSAFALSEQLHAFFESASIIIEGGHLIELTRQLFTILPDPNVDAGWQAVTRYKIFVQPHRS